MKISLINSILPCVTKKKTKNRSDVYDKTNTHKNNLFDNKCDSINVNQSITFFF